MAVPAGGTDGGDRGFEVARAGRSAVCAAVELRQVAVEQARDMAADRMGVVEDDAAVRSEEHTSELQSLMRISYPVLWLQKKITTNYWYSQRPKLTSHRH